MWVPGRVARRTEAGPILGGVQGGVEVTMTGVEAEDAREGGAHGQKETPRPRDTHGVMTHSLSRPSGRSAMSSDVTALPPKLLG